MLFGSGIGRVRSGAHCTLPAVESAREEDRRKTLLALIELAEGFSPTDCWDDERAMALLRSQSTPDELRTLGMSERLIAHVFTKES